MSHGLDLHELDQVSDVTCLVSASDFVLAYVNLAWVSFGTANGASSVSGPGVCLLDALPASTRAFFRYHLVRVLSDGVNWEYDYDCSSPSSRREFRLRVLLVGDGRGLLLTHARRITAPLDALDIESYLNRTGFLVQCAHCKRFLDPASRTWEWIPALCGTRVETTHGMCELCLAYYFAPAAMKRQ